MLSCSLVIRQELKEITGAYGGDDVDGEDGSSYLEEEAKINTGIVTGKQIGRAHV